MATDVPVVPHGELAREARKRFVADAGRAMQDLGTLLESRLAELMAEPAPSREMNLRRDAWLLYQRQRKAWFDGTLKAWQAALTPETSAPKATSETAFELVGTEAVEDGILASRLTLGLIGNVSSEFNDLQLRLKSLQDMRELESTDIVRPEVLFLAMIERWSGTGMSRQTWFTVSEVAQKLWSERLLRAYSGCNAFLIKAGVLPTITLEDRVKRSPGSAPRSAPPKPTWTGTPRTALGPQQSGASGFGARHDSGYGGAETQTRMSTRGQPAARAHSQAQGVVAQLKRLLVSSGVTGHESAVQSKLSPTLAAAMARRSELAGAALSAQMALGESELAGLTRVSNALRHQTKDLKSKAATQNEKAVIEVVALMFQAILQEDRIPSAIRVWIARLQMPVLRVALAEPDFFGTLDHPARQLIDRMGSCAMGFDTSGIKGNALETEVKRVVQVIEQYPETGRRVYQLVYDEFQKFLAQFLTGKASTQRALSVAQQVEQKETLTIQYTIEMRNILKDMPVSDASREFRIKVRAEVLAVAAVREGPQHADTLALKKVASDLVWCASAKPNRVDRARVIADLPKLLQKLRVGMGLLGVTAAQQDAHIKAVNDTLADAFVSKTQAIPAAQIAALSARLAHLEDFVEDESTGDLLLDAQSIEMMLGIDASNIDVVTDGGSTPSAAMQAWAQELLLGTWFTLDHNARVVQVQFVWRSPRKHLSLFASTDGRSYLIQAARLAAYLQAGLLIPEEDETLTVRATRDALAKLTANPERLLN